MRSATDGLAAAGLGLLLLLLAPLLLSPGGARAADDPTGEDALLRHFLSADRFDLDLFAPSGPAIVTMGASPRQASEPGAIQDFAIDLGTVNDGTGTHLAAAVSALPYWWGGRALTLDEYRTQTSPFARILARTQGSIGLSTAGADPFDALRLGLGLQTQLLDAQDHRMDAAMAACLHSAWDTHRRSAHERAAQALAAAITEAEAAGRPIGDIDLGALQLAELSKGAPTAWLAARESCQEEGLRRLLARPSWLVGLGASARSEEDAWGSLAYDGLSGWTSLRLPLAGKGRYAGFAFLRGDLDRVFDFDDGGTAEGDALTGGLGLGYQTPAFRLDLSAAHTHRRYEGSGEEDFQRYGASLDLRLFEGFWLELSGGTTVSSETTDGVYGGVSVKVSWGDYLPFLGGAPF
ncbi:MAG: hypothetical protein HXY25_10010 [Alphaproteobacteria bacterium]|nr:hypothetical protein [Alphaproteobacteria bacterium]